MILNYYMIVNKDIDGFDIPLKGVLQLFDTEKEATEHLNGKKSKFESFIKEPVITKRKLFSVEKHTLFSNEEVKEMKWFNEHAYVKKVLITV